jgi:segregation and condensation protein A
MVCIAKKMCAIFDSQLPPFFKGLADAVPAGNALVLTMVTPAGLGPLAELAAEINATVFDLINVFQKILARQKEQIEFEIEREEISMADMLKELKRRLTEFKELSVTGFFEEMRSRRELVTAFIAILEIVRTEGIRLMQSATFGDIVLKKS